MSYLLRVPLNLDVGVSFSYEQRSRAKGILAYCLLPVPLHESAQEMNPSPTCCVVFSVVVLNFIFVFIFCKLP